MYHVDLPAGACANTTKKMCGTTSAQREGREVTSGEGFLGGLNIRPTPFPGAAPTRSITRDLPEGR